MSHADGVRCAIRGTAQPCGYWTVAAVGRPGLGRARRQGRSRELRDRARPAARRNTRAATARLGILCNKAASAASRRPASARRLRRSPRGSWSLRVRTGRPFTLAATARSNHGQRLGEPALARLAVVHLVQAHPRGSWGSRARAHRPLGGGCVLEPRRRLREPALRSVGAAGRIAR
jgi:hypothetical protein